MAAASATAAAAAAVVAAATQAVAGQATQVHAGASNGGDGGPLSKRRRTEPHWLGPQAAGGGGSGGSRMPAQDALEEAEEQADAGQQHAAQLPPAQLPPVLRDSTPRGAVAAQLLVHMAGQPAAAGSLLQHASLALAPPPAVRHGTAGKGGPRWWQLAVQPELAMRRLAGGAPPAAVAAAVAAAGLPQAVHAGLAAPAAVQADPTAHQKIQRQQPQAQQLGMQLEDMGQQAQQAQQELPSTATAATALLGELLGMLQVGAAVLLLSTGPWPLPLLLFLNSQMLTGRHAVPYLCLHLRLCLRLTPVPQVVVSAADAEEFLELVIRHGVGHNTAAATAAEAGAGGEGAAAAAAVAGAGAVVGASPDVLLAALASDLQVRVAATRQLLQERRQAELAEGVQCALRAGRLARALSQLSGLLVRQQQQAQ